jgi:hypothetical protein
MSDIFTKAHPLSRKQSAAGAGHGFIAIVKSLRGGRDVLRSGHQAGERVHREGEVQKAQPVSRGVPKHRRALRDGGDGGGVRGTRWVVESGKKHRLWRFSA